MKACAITLDIDWAPDVAIDYAARALLSRGIPATWFVTHASPAIERLRETPELFELGIHPNFLPGSTHGNSVDDIIAHCMNLVPEAKSVRTHALVQSTPLLMKLMALTELENDLSLFLPYAEHATPVEYCLGGHQLLRIPYVWEDDIEMEQPRPHWNPDQVLSRCDGYVIFDFHPIHIFLNSPSMVPYTKAKGLPLGLSAADAKQLEPLVHQGDGAGRYFLTLLDRLALTRSAKRVSDIASAWREASVLNQK